MQRRAHRIAYVLTFLSLLAAAGARFGPEVARQARVRSLVDRTRDADPRVRWDARRQLLALPAEETRGVLPQVVAGAVLDVVEDGSVVVELELLGRYDEPTELDLVSAISEGEVRAELRGRVERSWGSPARLRLWFAEQAGHPRDVPDRETVRVALFQRLGRTDPAVAVLKDVRGHPVPLLVAPVTSETLELIRAGLRER